jgi:uracil-DNA glycosylase
MTNQFPAPWLALLEPAAKAHLDRATAAAESAALSGTHIFPPRADWFAAFHHVAPQNVRVIILGQDPYPSRGNAMGLAFSVPRGVKAPASLKNIYKALDNDLGVAPALHGDLRSWATQGVLLLNSVLTVAEGQPNAHADLGWRELTDCVIASLGDSNTAKVFMLWGAHAQEKAPLIDAKRHLILSAPHPSPLSAYRGFLDCRHFSRANAFLVNHGTAPVDWALPA